MKNSLKKLVLAGLLLPLHAMADTHVLTAAEWSRPRSAEMVTGLEPVAAAVREWHAAAKENTQARIMLHHAAGEEAALWASELRDWLVALGVPMNAVQLEMGGVSDNEIELEIRDR